jgi:multiple antibiotic resistance protein
LVTGPYLARWLSDDHDSLVFPGPYGDQPRGGCDLRRGRDAGEDVTVDVRLFGEVLVTLLVIVDPPGMVPIFIALTAAYPARERARAAWQAVALAAAVIAVFALGGEQILRYLGIGLPALQAAGGLLLLLVALSLLTGEFGQPTTAATSNVALVPLGTPLLAGPGAIVATMLFVRRTHDAGQVVAIALGVGLVLLVVWLVLRFSGVVVRILRPGGIEVFSRVAGLLLAAIAVQLVADAVGAFVTAYLDHRH